jgi:hypothetical protein
MTRFFRFLTPVVFVTLLTVISQAQNAATSELHVTVRDPKGAVVTNATVAVRDEGKAFERSTTANSDGDYHLIALPPGVYTVTVESAGFAKAEVKDVTVTVGQSAELPVALAVSGIFFVTMAISRLSGRRRSIA